MKSKLVFSLLLAAISLFPGCYTVLLVEDSTESVSIQPAPTPQLIVEYIPIYVPEPYPIPNPPPVTGPILYPDPPTYIPAPVYVNDNPPSAPPPSSDNHREIHTGRSTPDSNTAPARNDNNNNGTRDSGVQRGKR
jgi:hypothetical protein